jgi:arsenate reductase
MAEGLLRHEAGDQFEVYSAGTNPTSVLPEAIAVMNAIRIDISSHRTKSVDEFVGRELDYEITVCDNANESCPLFPGQAKRLHWSFRDPASMMGSEEVRRSAFRKVWDQIHARIMVFLGENAT